MTAELTPSEYEVADILPVFCIFCHCLVTTAQCNSKFHVGGLTSNDIGFVYCHKMLF